MREVLLNDLTLGIQCGSVANFVKGTDTKSANLPQNLQSYHSNTANLNHSGEATHEAQAPQDSKILQDSQQTQETTQSGRIFELESGLYKTCARSLLKVSAEAQGEVIADSSQKDNAKTAKTSQTDKTKQITLHSKYGTIKATFETNSQSIMLPFTKGGEYFVFDSVRFYVMQGEGALYYLDCVKDYYFGSLSTECLEQFLLTGKYPRDYKQRELINDFLEVDTKNIQKNKNYLLPKYYEILQIYLMGDFYDS